MKKDLSLMLVLALIFSLAACGGSSDGANTSAPPEATVSSDPLPDSPAPSQEISFDPVTVIDNDDCVLRVTGLEPDNLWGYTLKAYLENKSADKTYMFSLTNCAVNDVQCSSIFAEEVAPGKKANSDITLSDSRLEENGITEYTDIELAFRVYDSNDWSADNIAAEIVHIYPYGSDHAAPFTREAQPTDNIIIDNDAVTVIVTGYEQDTIWGYTVNLFLCNKTDSEVMFSVNDASVNGFMMDPFYASSLAAKKYAFSSMSWSDSAFQENQIANVEEIEFQMKAYDANNWSIDPFANETIVLHP